MEKLMRANIIKVGGKPWTTYDYEDGGTPFKQQKHTRDSGGSSETSSAVRTGSLKAPMTPIQKLPISTADRVKVTEELAEGG